MPDQSPVLTIARALQERAPQAHSLIRRMVRVLGEERVWTFVRAAQAVEEAGGVWLETEQRRRTLGGVFFARVRADSTDEERASIWGAHRKGQRKPSAPPTAPQPAATSAASPYDWAQRGALLARLAGDNGKADTVKVTIIGRPGKVIEQPAFTLLRMRSDAPLPALPKGLPVPEHVPPTTYVVYVAAKQWRAVAASLNHADDALIIEGRQFWDAELGAMAVFATSTTTKLLQQAKRPAKEASS